MGEAQRGRERAVFFIPNSPRTAPLSRSTSSLFFFPHQRSTLSPQAAHLPQAAHHAHAHHDLARRHRRGGHPELDRHGTKREVFSLFFFSEREKKPRNSHLFFSFPSAKKNPEILTYFFPFSFAPPPVAASFPKNSKKKKLHRPSSSPSSSSTPRSAGTRPSRPPTPSPRSRPRSSRSPPSSATASGTTSTPAASSRGTWCCSLRARPCRPTASSTRGRSTSTPRR